MWVVQSGGHGTHLHKGDDLHGDKVVQGVAELPVPQLMGQYRHNLVPTSSSPNPVCSSERRTLVGKSKTRKRRSKVQ